MALGVDVALELCLGLPLDVVGYGGHLAAQERPQVLQVDAVLHDYDEGVGALVAAALAVLHAELVADDAAVFDVVEVDGVLEDLAV